MAQTSNPPPVSPPAVTCRSGVLGWLWSLLGSTTPAYGGSGQPVAGRGWCRWFSTTPTYQVAPKDPAPKADDDILTHQGAVAIVIRRE